MEPKETKAFVPQSMRSRFVVTASLVAALTSGGAALAPALALADELPDAGGSAAISTEVAVDSPASSGDVTTVYTEQGTDAATDDTTGGAPTDTDSPADVPTDTSTDTSASTTGEGAATKEEPTDAPDAAADKEVAKKEEATDAPADAIGAELAQKSDVEGMPAAGSQDTAGVANTTTLETEGDTDAPVAEKQTADIVFVVDTTGSMGGTIDSVSNNLYTFCNSLVNDNVDARFALYEFKDATVDGEANAFGFVTFPTSGTGGKWTQDPEELRTQLQKLDIDGGGDGPETPDYALDRVDDELYTTDGSGWRSGATRYVFLITDADYKDGYDGQLSSMAAIASYLADDQVKVIVISDPYYKEHYAALYEPTSGTFIDIYGDYSELMLQAAQWVKNNSDPADPVDPAVEAAAAALVDKVQAPNTIEVNGTPSQIIVVGNPKLKKVTDNVYEVKRMPELDRDSLVKEASKTGAGDASEIVVENYWWYVYIEGEKTYIMDANGNLAEGIDQVYWSPEDAAYVVRFKDGEKVLIAESSGAIVALTPKSKLGVDLVLKSSGGSTDDGETVPADTGSVYTPSRLPNTGSVYADKAREQEKIAETGDATNMAVPATLTFAGVAAILAARARKESKQRDN